MTLKALTLSELKKKVDQALEEHGDMRVHQWSECDDMWFTTYEAGAIMLHIDPEFSDDGEEKEYMAFCLDYT